MKKKHFFWITILSLSISIHSYGQAVISVANNNYLYANIENNLMIAIPGIKSNMLVVSCTNAIIKKKDSMSYSIIPKFPTASIHIYALSNKDTIMQDHQTFRVIRIPNPDLYLLHINISKNKQQFIDRKKLFSSPFLILKYPTNFILIKEQPIISSFNISYTIGNQLINKFIKGNKIPHNIIIELDKLPTNTKITIDNIYSNKQKTSIKCSFILS